MNSSITDLLDGELALDSSIKHSDNFQQLPLSIPVRHADLDFQAGSMVVEEQDLSDIKKTNFNSDSDLDLDNL